jgi:predicted ATP-grasp superfamily ATP-dependent carboligase
MKILISGIGGPTPLGIAKSLRLKYKPSEITLIGLDGSKLAPGLYNKELFDKTYLVPHSHDATYWSAIDEIVAKEGIDHAFIIPETEVLVWSKRQKERGLPCSALIAQSDVADAFYDKYKTFDLLKDTDMVPRSIKLDANTDLDNIGKELGYPYWIRGGSGAGAIGAYKIEELKDIKNWMNINPRIDDFLASVFLPGRNYACKMLFIGDKLVRSACGERIDYLMSNAAPSGISGMCARGRLLNNRELVEKSEVAIRQVFKHFNLPAHGMFTVDFKEDKDGEAKITEVNIRHVSFSHAFSLGGANFAADTLEALSSNSFDKEYKMYEFDDEYTFIRGVDSALFLIKDSDLLKPFVQ